jgi:uncharacterized protein (TIGR03437 family)
MRSLALILAALVAGLQVPALGQSVLNLSPSRIVGQRSLTITSAAPNLVEGRELNAPLAVAVDRSSTPPVLYVADFGNNRVMAWRNATGFANGAPADFVLGQVDKFSTLQQGPGSGRSTGLSNPNGLAVDARGNLYVSDAGNNRILRFPTPAKSTDDIQLPDMVIGQPSLTATGANNGGVSASSVFLSTTSSIPGRSNLAFDPQGNLWLADSLNHRLLRYPAAALTAGTNRPAADLVLGQQDFNNVTQPTVLDPNTQQPVNITDAQFSVLKSAIRRPISVAVDSEGRVYASDDLGRVLVYTGPLATGKDASRIVGILVTKQGQQPQLEYLLRAPQGIFIASNNRLGATDPVLNRIVLYDPFPSWPAESEDQISPPGKVVLGQPSFTSFDSNRGLAEPNETSLSQPQAAFQSGSELYVADTINHRVLVFPDPVSNAVAATRVAGQPSFNLNAVNYVEGRELFLWSGFTSASSGGANLSGEFSDGAGLAIDTKSDQPHLYVADTFNNRILGYRDVRRVRPGDKADIVIGQSDFNRVLINAPSNNRESQTNSGLYRPSGLAVDANGDLWVADSGNGRVLRFPKPFDQNLPAGERQRANLVIGQQNFNQRIVDPSSRNMAYPFGLAFSVEGHLLVSDAVHSRILFFRKPANGDFTNGQAAERVIGQPDFLTVGRGTTLNRMSSPRHIATDTDDRLYVADSGNNRVLVYDRITVVGNDPSPAFQLTGVNQPQGVFVSALTGEIWVANTRQGRATRFPRFERLAIDAKSDYDIPTSSFSLALTQDASGNLYVAEATNRIAIFYNALAFQIAGNYSTRPLSPGAIATIYPAGAGVKFSENSTPFTTLPLPKNLADVQVLLNEQPVPLYLVSPFQINFLVPMSAPDSGTAEIQVVKQSTGQILAVSNPQFDRVSPALFVQGGALQGQIAALNEDGSINGPGNGIERGKVLQMFGTGQGFVPNAPADGTAPTGLSQTQDRPRVFLGGTDFLPDSEILYSGLAPGLPGVWQINARVPMNAAPGVNDAFVQLRSVLSNRTAGERIIRTTYVVK